MTTYTVTIKNINASVEGIDFPKGEARNYTVKADDFAQAIEKGVKQAFGNEAHFTHTSGYGEVAFSNGDGQDLYGRIHADYQHEESREMISYTDLIVTDENGNQSNLDAMMLNLDYSLRKIKLAADGSIAEWDGKFISAYDEEPNWDTPKVAVDWTGFADRIKPIQEELNA